MTTTDFVAWCHQGLRKAGAAGEVLIADSSSDRTADLAWAGGARVLKAPRRGFGRAYIDALPFVRGKFVIMGDADCTYHFRELAPFDRRDAPRHRIRDGPSRASSTCCGEPRRGPPTIISLAVIALMIADLPWDRRVWRRPREPVAAPPERTPDTATA